MKLTDEQAIAEFKACLAEIRETPEQYGYITTEVSGGWVKFTYVTKPPKESVKRPGLIPEPKTRF